MKEISEEHGFGVEVVEPADEAREVVRLVCRRGTALTSISPEQRRGGLAVVASTLAIVAGVAAAPVRGAKGSGSSINSSLMKRRSHRSGGAIFSLERVRGSNSTFQLGKLTFYH